MPESKTGKRVVYNPAAVAKYSKANYDDLKIRVKKGRRDEISGYAQSAGQSVNAYVIQAVEERIAREKGAGRK